MVGWDLAPIAVAMMVVPKQMEKIPSASLVSERRQFLEHFIALSSATTAFVTSPSNAETGVDSSPPPNADGGGELESLKPFAPVSALLPATRARTWVEEAYQISTTLRSDMKRDAKEQYQTLERLNDVLSHRPQLFKKGEKMIPRVGSTALAQFTAKKTSSKLSNIITNRDVVDSQDPFASSPTLADKFSKALNQADVSRQWGILQAQESRTESQNELRAAWNFYTQQLEFNPSSYEWRASAEEKKRRIRNDQLPTPQAVIVSDLDLRDLYRNQLLTALDDVAVEVQYQLKEGGGPGGETDNTDLDVTDTVDLMNQAHTACSKWFDMIDKRDVKEAELTVQKE